MSERIQGMAVWSMVAPPEEPVPILYTYHLVSGGAYYFARIMLSNPIGEWDHDDVEAALRGERWVRVSEWMDTPIPEGEDEVLTRIADVEKVEVKVKWN